MRLSEFRLLIRPCIKPSTTYIDKLLASVQKHRLAFTDMMGDKATNVKGPFEVAVLNLDTEPPKELDPLLKILGRWAMIKFIKSWQLSPTTGEPTTFLIMVGQQPNMEVCERILCNIHRGALGYIEATTQAHKRAARRNRRHKKPKLVNASVVRSEATTYIWEVIPKKLEQVLEPCIPNYRRKDELTVVRFIDGRFKMKLSKKKGPIQEAEVDISQFFGKDIHQIRNRWAPTS